MDTILKNAQLRFTLVLNFALVQYDFCIFQDTGISITLNIKLFSALINDIVF